MNPRFAVAVTVCLLLATAPSFGQEPTEPGDLFRQFIEDEARVLSLNDTQDHDLQALVGMILKVRICVVLKLEEDKCLSLMSRIGKELDTLHNYKWERGGVKHYLRELPKRRDRPKREDIAKAYEMAERLDHLIAELEPRIARMTRDVLTLEQQVALYVFLDDFSSELAQLARKAERRANTSETPERDPSPAEDDDR